MMGLELIALTGLREDLQASARVAPEVAICLSL